MESQGQARVSGLLHAALEDWLVLRRGVTASFPFHKFHFGSHRENESEPPAPTLFAKLAHF